MSIATQRHLQKSAERSIAHARGTSSVAMTWCRGAGLRERHRATRCVGRGLDDCIAATPAQVPAGLPMAPALTPPTGCPTVVSAPSALTTVGPVETSTVLKPRALARSAAGIPVRDSVCHTVLTAAAFTVAGNKRLSDGPHWHRPTAPLIQHIRAMKASRGAQA